MPNAADIPNVLLGVTSAANLVVMWFVYERGPRNPVNRLFALFVFFIAAWALAILCFRTVTDTAAALLLIKLSYVSALLLAFCFYRFALLFPRIAPISAARRLSEYLVVAAVTAALLVPGVLAEGIRVYSWGKEVALEPAAWSVFAVVFLFFFVSGQVRLLRNVPLARGVERTQLIIIAWTVAVIGLFGIVFNLLLPSPFLENFRYIWTGPLFTFIFAVVITYAIFRYKLFNPQAAVSELLVLALVLVLLVDAMLAASVGERWLDGSLLAAASIVGALLIGSINRDIRQREIIEAQRDSIEQASAEKSEFMSFASHEIRNPVTAIRGYASLMLEGNIGSLSPPALETVNKIAELSEEVLQLISQYLAKSKAELGQITYEPTIFDFSTTALEIADAARAAAQQKGLVLNVNIDGSVPLPVRADKIKIKIKEAIGNIIDNAVKYTPVGSVTVALDRHGDTARLVVKDTGIGIPPEVLPHLFAKFSRADAHHANIQGSGIGLYLAKTFIETHGGTIRVESTGEGKGSTFVIELPLAQVQRRQH